MIPKEKHNINFGSLKMTEAIAQYIAIRIAIRPCRMYRIPIRPCRMYRIPIRLYPYPPLVSKLVCNRKRLVFHQYLWQSINLTRFRLIHHFCFIYTDGQGKVVTGSGKVVHAILHFLFRASIKGAVVK